LFDRSVCGPDRLISHFDLAVVFYGKWENIGSFDLCLTAIIHKRSYRFVSIFCCSLSLPHTTQMGRYSVVYRGKQGHKQSS
ncbi:MAG: hypothetical protein AAGM67_02285, partial [Bacteroidota bacterium]